MIKMLLAFVVTFSLMFILIPQYRNLTGKEKWGYVKLALFSLLCAGLSIGLLSLFVILF